jgi:ribosomal protein L16 Arg81 hydroxylase
MFGFHADGVTGPPPPRDGIDGPEAFAALIAEHHRRGYTVHVPDIAVLAPPLRRFVTALEYMLHQPAKTSVFWSRPGNRAPVHYDDRDNIAIQLVGRKRWYVSTEQPSLHNPWRGVAEGPSPLGPYRVIDAAPGDLLFIPRGLRHTVETVEESLHLSVTILPVTVRDAIIATLDHLSDHDRALRDTALGRFDALGSEIDAIQARLVHGLEALLDHCRSSEFVASAIQRRSSRVFGDMPKLLPSDRPEILPADTILMHAEGAMAMMLATPDLIDFAQPGTHIHIHRGAEEALSFIATTPRFRLGDVPGLDEAVSVALVERLLQSGFLAVAPPGE